MEARFMFCFWFLAATAAAGPPNINLEFDRPSMRIQISSSTTLECCYKYNLEVQGMWIKSVMVSRNETEPKALNITHGRLKAYYKEKDHGVKCHYLELNDVTLNDTGLYQCSLNATGLKTILTPGTFLQVFVPIKKNLNISEKMKNSIITAEGVLLLLCMLLPGSMLFCKGKSLNGLQKKKEREEENIYEGLNLDDCNSTYHQILRSQVQGPYQDVMNTLDEDIQLEKP